MFKAWTWDIKNFLPRNYIRLVFWKDLSGNSTKDGIKKYKTRKKWEHLAAATDTRNDELNVGSDSRDIQILLISTLCQVVCYVLGSG